MPTGLIIVLCIVAFLIIVFIIADIAIGNYFYEYSIARHPKVSGASGSALTKKGERPLTELGDTCPEWINEVDAKGLTITSFDGLKLHGDLVVNEGSNKLVILCHGYKNDPLLMCYCAKQFYKEGFSCFIPHARGHGKSEGEYIDMGWFSRLDVVKWINYLNEELSNPQIILYGISMGASTVMNVAGEELPENVKCAIEDCGYTSMKAQFLHVLKNLKNLPPHIILHFASHVIKRKAHINIYKDNFSIEAVKQTKLPMFFVQGDQDRFVPYSMLKENYDAHPGPKETLTIEGAAHASSAWAGGDLYWNSIFNFINKYLK